VESSTLSDSAGTNTIKRIRKRNLDTMKIFSMTKTLLAGVLLMGALAPAHAAQNMIGRQSQNEGMLVVPAPGKVAVDGDLKDWDWSGRIWVFADSAVRERFSVEAAAMWDKDNLYLAAKWKDPTPMFGLIDPAINPNEGWKEDAWQMRVLTDHPLWLTAWYYTTQKQPALHIARWKDPTNERNGTDPTLLVAKPGGTDLGEGVQMAYRKDDDGKGFTQEIKIPWRVLYKTMPEVKPGLTLRLGNEFLWGDPTGVTFPIHRYADNMQPGKTSREFYWSAKNDWGDAKLVEKGKVPLREYIGDGARVEGTMPVRVTIPKDAARFTVVLEDSKGDRVRTLAADADPADYAVPGKDTAQARVMEVKWDGLDDKGRMAAPGAYKVRGLTHRGLGAEYEMTFYNPGTPPWPTVDGRGGWGADHTAPIAVAAGGDWTLVTWPFVEGGNGIIGLDANGQKRWGDRRGVSVVAADDQYAYGYVTGWYVEETLCRFDIKTGATKPFILDGKERTFDLPLKEILGVEEPGKVTGLAVHGGQLVVALSTGKIAILDAASARVLRQFDAPGIGPVAFSRDGKLYGLQSGEANRIDVNTGTSTPISTPGVEKPVALAIDLDGNLVIADAGADSQVKAFSPDGKLVYTAGKKGGRPIRGAFDEQAMSHLSSVAVDKQGRIWTVESWNYPRRVAVWGRDGKLVREYLGNTGYAGANSYLHEQDPTLGYVGPMEFKLDKSTRGWKLQNVLWVPDESRGESFMLETASNVIPQRFTREVNGQKREYMFAHETDVEWGTGNVVFMERNGRWQPVAAICMAIHISGKAKHAGGVILEQPSGELEGLNAYDGIIWNDDNRDGKVQRVECTVVKATQPGDEKRGGRCPLPLNNGWGGRMGDDFSIYAEGITRYKPLRFTDDGAPIYSLEGKTDVGVPFNGDFVPVPGEDRLIALMTGGSQSSTLQMVNLKSGVTEWTYPNPYPGVHGSHRATMPKPGLLIGPLKTCGVAHISDAIGNVFLIRGNLGQDFLYTSDGLYVGAMFQDGRLPNESLPETEAKLIGMPMETFSEGGEPFNGWFGKQSDGKVRLTTGMPRQAAMVMEIKGLETIRRFDGSTLSVDQKQLIAADADNTARARKAVAAKQYTITRLAAAPKIDGGEGDWKNVPALTIEREGQPDRASVKLGYDATNLYALFEVQDPTPWRNAGKDFANLFKTGDALDIQFSADPNAKSHAEPQAGDKRIVIAQFEKKPVAVLMAPVDKTAPANTAKSFTSPVGTKKFDRVEVLTAASVAEKSEGNRYRVEVSIPLTSLGLAPQSGQSLRGDVGFISSDAAGLINTARTYWSNSQTNLVNDEPLEAWIYPATWGELKFE
jgi:hypothetical protein